MVPIDQNYTLADHEGRDDDHYALAKFRLTLRWLGESGGQRSLLNVGCGSGVFNELAFEAGFRVSSVEPDPAAWELASRRGSGRYPVLNLGLFDLDERFASDIVVMHDVLEHIDQEEEAIDKLEALIKPGGVAVVSVPALESLFGFHDRQLGHYRRYRAKALRMALGRKFEVKKIRYLGITGIPFVFWYSRVRDAPYPVQRSEGFVARMFSLVCALESRCPFPVGTSVVAFVRRSSS